MNKPYLVNLRSEDFECVSKYFDEKDLERAYRSLRRKMYDKEKRGYVIAEVLPKVNGKFRLKFIGVSFKFKYTLTGSIGFTLLNATGITYEDTLKFLKDHRSGLLKARREWKGNK